MEKQPFISIITVCYNSEKTIGQTIESVLNQGYKNYEYIIVDGKSSDNTLKIASSYLNKFEGKLKIISEKDNGIYDAMNKGILKCSGNIIGIVNSDDWYEKETLEEVAKRFEKEKMQVIYGYQRLIKNEKEYEINFKSFDFINERMINHPTCFISKNIYDKYGLYDISLKSSADYEFMLRISKDIDIVFTKVEKILSNFRLGGESSSQVGVIETAELRYKYGYISKKQFLRKLIVSKTYMFLKFISKGF
ncbi:glycosyltransferase family 2 protein [Clostridium perfringens]|uniref:glycosyltransferase family 2 protein n=1 Tax=Clostridium perfringens TaxID=1502 RepID=UPI002AC699FC|nr:glycosyltransferase family 2 protein [Clostridium perfringens]MDZ5065936.1 glycosyltransferase [Clostridium perfringens]